MSLKIRSTNKTLAVVGGLLLASACSSARDPGEPPPVALDTVGPSVAADEHPAATVTIPMANGNVVEIYDFNDRALVMETGAPPTLPALKGPPESLIRNNDLVGLFAMFRPGVEVPAALVDLQARVAAGAVAPQGTVQVDSVSKKGTGGTTSGAATGVVANGGPGVGSDAGLPGKASVDGGPRSGIQPADACSNGCCDYNWLTQSGGICNGDPGNSSGWFQFDYGWSYVSNGSITGISGDVCAGSGTSNFTVSITGGSGGTWSVPAATYRHYWWDVSCAWPFTCSQSMQWWVNSPSTTELETFCGFDV